jgi:hypothetical protein
MVNTALNVNLHNIIRIPSSILLLRKTLEKLRTAHDETTTVFGEGSIVGWRNRGLPDVFAMRYRWGCFEIVHRLGLHSVDPHKRIGMQVSCTIPAVGHQLASGLRHTVIQAGYIAFKGRWRPALPIVP